MSGRGSNRWETYTVPAGRRAVVTSVSFSSFVQPDVFIYLRVHGIPVLSWPAPGSNSAFIAAVRFTAYVRETIEIAVVGTDLAYAVDGYLFFDDQDTPDDADNVITPMPTAELRPSAVA